MKSCQNTLEIVGNFQLKDEMPNSLPIQTIRKRKNTAIHFHSHLSDESKKNAAKTHTHMLVLAQCLMGGNMYLLKEAPSLLTQMATPNNFDVSLSSICFLLFCSKKKFALIGKLEHLDMVNI